MKRLNEIVRIVALMFAGVLLFAACSKDNLPVTSDVTLSDKEALLKLIDEDEAIQSFEPNYNEQNAMDFLGKTNNLIYPVRVGQKMNSISRTLDVQFDGDSAYGVITRKFEGTLIIEASYDPFTVRDSSAVDTVITKDFSTTMTRNIVFAKMNSPMNFEGNGGPQGGGMGYRDNSGGMHGRGNGNNGGEGNHGNGGMHGGGIDGFGGQGMGNNDLMANGWRIVAMSLPEGGTLTENISIKKVTVFLPSGDTLSISSPNDYYITREPGSHHGFMHMLPSLNWNQEVTVRVELQSAYADTDFVSLTYGAIRGGEHHRAKKKFELISETFDGTSYLKIYEQTWQTRQSRGWKHAIINAVPKQVAFDDSAPVEENTWGIPYKVN